MTFYVTGLGLTFPLSQDGSVSAPPLPVPVGSISLYVGNQQVQPDFAAAADGLVAGITEINVRVPVATYQQPVYGSINGAFSQIYIEQ